jgi:hypothetical protein
MKIHFRRNRTKSTMREMKTYSTVITPLSLKTRTDPPNKTNA